MSLTLPTSNTSPTVSEIVSTAGADLVPGYRFLVQNPMTGEKHWTAEISHFTTPRIPERAENRVALPPAGTRIAWSGRLCLGEIRPDAYFLTLPHPPVADEDAWLYGGGA